MSKWARCPGSGLPLREFTYIVRRITDEDRQEHSRLITRLEAGAQRSAERRFSDPDERAQELAELMTSIDARKRRFARWERDQGTPRQATECSVCKHPWVSATRDGRARGHKRYDSWATRAVVGSWDRVDDLMEQIKVLHGEVQRLQEEVQREMRLLDRGGE